MSVLDLEKTLLQFWNQLEVSSSAEISLRGDVYYSTANEIAKTSLERRVAQVLYDQFYMRQRSPEASRELDGIEDMLPQLRAANATELTWDEAWTVYRHGTEGRVYVKKGDRSRAAGAGAYICDEMTGGIPPLGSTVRLRVYPENCQLQADFYHSFGRQLVDQYDEFDAVRIYFNVYAHGAATLLKVISTCLNRYEVPFHFKTLRKQKQYGRADAAVIYLARRYFSFAWQLLDEELGQLHSIFHPDVPLFTKYIMPGVAIAEEPGNGESFGMHRCRLVSEAIVPILPLRELPQSEVIGRIKTRFENEGLNLARPYLKAGSIDNFASSHEFQGGGQ